jgi:hypothetical protein
MKKRNVLVPAIAFVAVALLTAAAWSMYNPRLGRFMQRDPIEYADGMNRYEFARSNPVTHCDPSGLKVIWFSVKPDGKPDGDGAWEQDEKGLKEYNGRVQQFLDKLKQVAPQVFKEAQNRKPCGVILNGKPYTEADGNLDDFKKIVEGELHSVHVVQTAGGYKAALKKFKELAALADQAYDDLGFDTHGTHITTVTRNPQGEVVDTKTVTGFVFNGEPIEGDKVRKDVGEIAAAGKGTFVGPVACFQERTKIESLAYDKESYFNPDPKNIDLTPLKGSSNGKPITKPWCQITFKTLKLVHRRDGEVVPH